MARFRLTIQKKFLIIIMTVGLIPAVLGMLVVSWGSRYAFKWAMGGALSARAVEIANQIDLICEKQAEALRNLVAQRGGDFEALRRDAAALGGVDIVVHYPSAKDYRIYPIRAKDPAFMQNFKEISRYFEVRFRLGGVRPEGFFDTLGLPLKPAVASGGAPAEEEEPPGGWLVSAFPAKGGGLVFFLTRGDYYLQQARTATVNQEDVIQLYSTRGPMLTTNAGPSGLLRLTQETLTPPIEKLSGLFSLNEAFGVHPSWHLVAYSASRRFARRAEDDSAGPPWVVLISYDMENFLGPQSMLIWLAVLSAVAWALLLIAITLAATRKIVFPVKLLRKQVEEMARGNLDAQAEVRTGDEIQDLAEAFNSMAGRLRESHDRITRFNQELEHRIEDRTADLARANQKLVQTEKYAATGRLAANLAHEINNPLGIIKNYLRLVGMSGGRSGGGRRASDPSEEHLKTIDEEIDRIARIVRQLLHLHRPVEQSVAETDINAMLDGILSLMEKSLEKEGIQIETAFDPGLPHLMVSTDLIRQVLINLLQNAHDAMEGTGGRLSVKTQSQTLLDGGQPVKAISISITDTGCGIRPENLGRIFDPFFSTKSSEKGTGLGLAVSYGIIQMYQGNIEVASEPSKGTTMVVSLPVNPRRLKVQKGDREGGPRSGSDGSPPDPLDASSEVSIFDTSN